MEQNFRSELKEEVDHIDVDSLKIDAVIQLRTWQKRMYSMIDKTYKKRLHEIDSIAKDITNEIEENQNQMANPSIQIDELIPENLDRRIERTIRVSRRIENLDGEIVDEEEEEDDDDDEPVLIDIDRREEQVRNHVVVAKEKTEQPPVTHEEGRVAKIFYSEPVQRSLAIGLAKTIAQMGAVAATSTTTIAATTMAKTAIIATACGVGTVAYGVGKIAVGTTRKIWSWAVSSDE